MIVDNGTSPVTRNAFLTGLKFFFGVALRRGELSEAAPGCFRTQGIHRSVLP